PFSIVSRPIPAVGRLSLRLHPRGRQVPDGNNILPRRNSHMPGRNNFFLPQLPEFLPDVWYTPTPFRTLPLPDTSDPFPCKSLRSGRLSDAGHIPAIRIQTFQNVPPAPWPPASAAGSGGISQNSGPPAQNPGRRPRCDSGPPS